MSTNLSSFQTLGVAPPALLASACGVAAASKRPFLLSGYPMFFLHAWLSDTQKNPHFRRNVCVIKVRICVRKLAENFGDCAVFEYAAFSIVSPDEGFKVA
jgi:hypothetical protein